MLYKIFEKVTSGRFILTVFCGAAFYQLAVTRALPTEAVVAIMTMVFVSYFQRDRKKESV